MYDTEQITAASILAAVEEALAHLGGAEASIAQTGGNCATVFVGPEDDDGRAVLAIGPGTYDWDIPDASLFGWADLWVGSDTDDAPESGELVTDYPSLVAAIARQWDRELGNNDSDLPGGARGNDPQWVAVQIRPDGISAIGPFPTGEDAEAAAEDEDAYHYAWIALPLG